MNYSTGIRALLCRHCGAPLTAAVTGGRVPCEYCRTTNVIEGRDDRALLLPEEPELAPDAYFARLRAQDGEPLRAPESLAHLLVGGQLDSVRLEEALPLFLATRGEVERTRGPEAAERLYWLAMVLSNHFVAARDHVRRRATLETALDVLFLPRHVQVVRCMLAQAAASEGDVDAAVAWLGPCSGRTGELESDSALRVASAFVYTVRGDFDGVLKMLGGHDEDIPIQDARDPMAAVLRANALERKQLVQHAVRALIERMRHEQPAGRSTMEAFAAAHAQFALCRKSLPVALARFRRERARREGQSGRIGWVLLAVALLMAVITVGVWRDLIRDGHLPDFDSPRGSHVAPWLFVPPFFMVVLGAMGWVQVSAARQNARLARRGVRAWGTVTAIQGTGLSIDNVPQVRVSVLVQAQGSGPTTASCVAMLTPELRAHVRVGAEVAVLIDPADPRSALIELD